MIHLKTYSPDTGTPAYWRTYAKAMGRKWGYIQAAKHFAANHGIAVIHHANDAATVIWRETGLSTFAIRSKRHDAVRWIGGAI